MGDGFLGLLYFLCELLYKSIPRIGKHAIGNYLFFRKIEQIKQGVNWVRRVMAIDERRSKTLANGHKFSAGPITRH
jgi:hypothetical protein